MSTIVVTVTACLGSCFPAKGKETCLEGCIGRPLPIFFFPLARTVSVCFFTGVAGLFLRPSAAFCPVVSSEVMPRMTVVVAVATRRKTCFPTVGGAIATKAKPSEDSTAFCVYLILMATIPNLTSRREMVKAWVDLFVARPAISNSLLEMKLEGCCATLASCPRNAWTVRRRNKKTGAFTKIIQKILVCRGKTATFAPY